MLRQMDLPPLNIANSAKLQQLPPARDTTLHDPRPRLAAARADAGIGAVLEGIGEAFYALDAEWRFTYINRRAETYFGVPKERMLGQVIWEVFPWSAGTDLRSRFEQVLLSGQPTSFEGAAVSSPDRYIELHAFPFEGGIAASFRDWTEQRRAEEILRESQAQLSALSDNLPLGMVYQMIDADDFMDRRFIYVSASCERLNGIPAERAIENPGALYELLVPEHRERVFQKQVESHVNRTPFDMEIAIRHGITGEIRWQRIVATRRELPNGAAVWDGIQIDITDHKRSEEHLHLLLNELNHRVKNTLAIVQSLAVQSLPKAALDDRFMAGRNAFETRLFALARGHDILTRENWEGASLATIVGEAFAPYRHDKGDAFEVEGEDLRITPAMALSLSMALHELCTNALKYGALGVPQGLIRVSWATSPAPDGKRLAMRWQETGGPPVSPPAHRGFGSRLIENGLARELNGAVKLTYEPTGLICTIDVPLP
jgi:PAS domain S-box-containing protein